MSWPRKSLPPRSARTSRLTTVKGACNSRHRASITGRADCATVTAREIGLMMPAFSRAMRETVFPKCSVCSRSTRVTTETRPSTIFAASIRPPIPTSITAMSTCRSRKYSKAGFLKDGGRVCAHGTLAVGAGDVEDLQAVVGIPKQGKKPSDVVQAKLDPEPLETIEVLECRVVVHRSGRG